MANVIRIWEITTADQLVEVPQLSTQDQGTTERDLEGWIVADPSAAVDDLLLIGRQVRTDSGPLDLLGIMSDGRLVVIELKRDRAPREAIAQALDYASFIGQQQHDWVQQTAQEYLRRPLGEAFYERFDQHLPEISLRAPAIRIVGSRLDSSTERMIDHLRSEYSMDIDGIVLRIATLSSGARLLTRISVGQETVTPADSPIATQLMNLASTHGTVSLVGTLRGLASFLWEQPLSTFDGSFRYWGFSKVLCGVNVSQHWEAPHGAIDVWVMYGSWANATDRDPETELLAPMESAGLPLVWNYPGSRRAVYRIASQQQATTFVDLLHSWYEGVSSSEV